MTRPSMRVKWDESPASTRTGTWNSSVDEGRFCLGLFLFFYSSFFPLQQSLYIPQPIFIYPHSSTIKITLHAGHCPAPPRMKASCSALRAPAAAAGICNPGYRPTCRYRLARPISTSCGMRASHSLCLPSGAFKANQICGARLVSCASSLFFPLIYP